MNKHSPAAGNAGKPPGIRHKTTADKDDVVRCVIMGALSGTLYLWSMPAVMWGGLAFIALVPLLVVILKAERLRQTLVASTAAGLFLFLPGIIWLHYVTILGYVLLALYCSVFVIAAAIAVHRLRRLPAPLFILGASSVWVMQEYLRSILLSGFPWFFLGHSQHAHLLLLQMADVAGVYGVSFLLFTINALIALICVRFSAGKPRIKAVVPAVLIIAVILALWTSYGAMRMARMKPRRLGFTVGMVQGNIPQSLKEIDDPSLTAGGIIDKFLDLSEQLKDSDKESAKEPLGLVIWPETTVIGNYLLNINPRLLTAAYRLKSFYVQARMAELTRSLNAPVLTGASSRTAYPPLYVNTKSELNSATYYGEKVYYNSAYLISRRGGLMGRYDKIHIVPFGEYVPFEKSLPFLRKYVPFDVSCLPGKRLTAFEMPFPQSNRGGKARFSVTICYEDTDAPLVRKMAAQDIDFLVNISNDAWFEESIELEQHLAAAVFRAVENRICVVRSGNNGITCVVDPVGRPVAYLEKMVAGQKMRKGFAGTLKAPVYGRCETSLYARVGDLPVLVCSLLVAGLTGFLTLKKRRKQGPEAEAGD